jgi:lipopolysaccharide/colanic/teichoic acid biosynthesis glycosyltransferase
MKNNFRNLFVLFVFTGVSPILLTLAIFIFYSIGTPVLFKQKRMGQNKKPFTMYKFRTMYVGAHRHQKRHQKLNQAPGPMFKIFDDPRFVGIGKFLSRTGLDELPQLLNVLKGEMNVVGPRPLPVSEANKLDKSWDFRYQVKPGIFSEWTASPLRHKSLSLWKELDRLTVQNCQAQRPWYSFHIIIKTIWQVLS